MNVDNITSSEIPPSLMILTAHSFTVTPVNVTNVLSSVSLVDADVDTDVSDADPEPDDDSWAGVCWAMRPFQIRSLRLLVWNINLGIGIDHVQLLTQMILPHALPSSKRRTASVYTDSEPLCWLVPPCNCVFCEVVERLMHSLSSIRNNRLGEPTCRFVPWSSECVPWNTQETHNALSVIWYAISLWYNEVLVITAAQW